MPKMGDGNDAGAEVDRSDDVMRQQFKGVGRIDVKK